MDELPQLWRSLSPSFLSFHTLCSFLTLAGHRIKDHSLSWGKKFVDIAEDNGIYRQTKSRLRELQVWRLHQGIHIHSTMRKTMCRSRKDHCGAALPGRGWLKINTMTGVRSLMFATRLRIPHFFSDEHSIRSVVAGPISVTIHADDFPEEQRSHVIRLYQHAKGVSDLARSAEDIEIPMTYSGIRARSLREGYAEKEQLHNITFLLKLTKFVPRPVGKPSLIQVVQLLAPDPVSGRDSQVLLGRPWREVSFSTTSFRQATCRASKA